MSVKASANGVRLRPHVKTHKCVEVARLQTAGHNGAITVSTLAEARAFAQQGFSDILYAVPIEPGKFDEVLTFAELGVNLSVITDDAGIPELLNERAARAGQTVSVFMKVDCGYHRCGVNPGSDEAKTIPRLIAESSSLTFVGILTHAGHSYHCGSDEEVLNIAQHERDSMVAFADELRCDGIEVPTVSIGSTPTMTSIDHLRGVDEIRPGNYIFFDAFQATLGTCGFGDVALTVLASVVHRDRTHGKVIVDAGAIALSKDRGAFTLDTACGYGRILDLEGEELGFTVNSLSQEHGVIEGLNESQLDRLSVGTRVRVLVNHSCLTAAQHDHYNLVEDGQIGDQWSIHRGW